jgi:very-short-patch-repair endonuclease
MDVPPRKTVIRARKLRRQMTLPEVLLWKALRAAPEGLKFRRQHPVGPYVLDFFCTSVRLCVEVDGAAHDMGENPARDEQRDAWLERQGIRTLRISAREVLADVEAAMSFILSDCSAHSPPPPPAAAVPLPVPGRIC